MSPPPAGGDGRAAVDAFIQTLQSLPPSAGVFNPWVDRECGKECADGPALRSANLAKYLNERIGTARVALIAEAPSCRGAKFSGIAMTSERIMLGYGRNDLLKRVADQEFRRTSLPEQCPKGRGEATATMVWSQMLALQYQPTEFVLWNAYPCHPHNEGDRFSNRKPSPAELASAAHVLCQFRSMFPATKLFALGWVAHDALVEMRCEEPYVRHPAKGGAPEFRKRMLELVPPARPRT